MADQSASSRGITAIRPAVVCCNRLLPRIYYISQNLPISKAYQSQLFVKNSTLRLRWHFRSNGFNREVRNANSQLVDYHFYGYHFIRRICTRRSKRKSDGIPCFENDSFRSLAGEDSLKIINVLRLVSIDFVISLLDQFSLNNYMSRHNTLAIAYYLPRIP